jgi:16S rRNA processing protein RimM
MELTSVGYFSKTHGIKGHLVLKTDALFDPAEIKAVFIQAGGSKAPYFVVEFKETNDSVMFLLEEINSVEKAKLLTGKEVFIESRFIEEDEAAENWNGFELIDATVGSLGEIIETSDNGEQVLVSVLYQNKEVILPLVDDFITRIDEENRKIFYEAPEGLIDIYLNE